MSRNTTGTSTSVNLRDLPEFYVLVDTQRKDLEDSSLAGSSTAHLASSERLKNLKKKIASSSKVLTKTMADSFYGDLRKAQRPLYNRGHEVHTAGDNLPFRALGMSPIASRGHTSTNRMAATAPSSNCSSRPVTRDGLSRGCSRVGTANSFSSGQGGLNRDGSPKREVLYSRPVSPMYTQGGTLTSGGLGAAGQRMSTPLQNITYSASSTMLARPTSSGYYPSDPDNILENTRAKAVNGFTTMSLCSRTPLEHRRYLSQRRVVTRLQTPAFRFNPPGHETDEALQQQQQQQQRQQQLLSSSSSSSFRGLGDGGDSQQYQQQQLPLSPAQLQMKQNIAAIGNRPTEVDGILFKIDYEPLGSKQRMKRSVCKIKTF